MNKYTTDSTNSCNLVLIGENQSEITLSTRLFKDIQSLFIDLIGFAANCFVLKGFLCSMCNLIEQVSEVVVIVHFLITYTLASYNFSRPIFLMIEVKYELINIPFQHKTQGRA